MPVLREYGPSLLAECDNHLALAHDLVAKWVEAYMFAGSPTAKADAQKVAAHLANHNNFLSHARRIGITELKELGVKVLDLRSQPPLREAIHDLYIALMLTFSDTGTIKIFENSRSKDDSLVISLNVVPQSPGAPGAPSAPVPRAPRTLPPSSRPPRGRRH
jgi:hypothetical protein